MVRYAGRFGWDSRTVRCRDLVSLGVAYLNNQQGWCKMRGYCGIGLDNPKSNSNVGAVLRAAGVYKAAFVFATGGRFTSCRTDTMKAYRHLPLMRVSELKEVVPYDCIPIAVDKIDGAIALPGYKHPERAFYIFGAEDNTLGGRITSWCRDVIYVPMDGCMNLAATVNVVLYDRYAKLHHVS